MAYVIGKLQEPTLKKLEEYNTKQTNLIKNYVEMEKNDLLIYYSTIKNFIKIERECYGSPDIEELRDYILLKLLSMFDKGVFASKAARRQRVTKYPGEIDFESIEDPEKRKKAYKNYDVFRKIVDYRDGFLIVDAYHAGHHFYTSKDEPNAKTLRNYFLKYIIKIELAQEEIRRLQAEQAEAAKRLAAGEKELNYFAPTKNLKMLFRE